MPGQQGDSPGYKAPNQSQPTHEATNEHTKSGGCGSALQYLSGMKYNVLHPKITMNHT